MSPRLRMPAFAPPRLSARDRRALRLGLFIITPVLFWLGAVRPWRSALSDLNQRIDAERLLLSREQSLIERASRLPEEMGQAAADAQRADRRLVHATNSALAEARVIEYLERVAERSRVLLTEVQSLQPDRRRAEAQTGPVHAIRLALHGESDLAGVTALLQRIEEGEMLLRVTELQLEPIMQRPRSNRRTTDDEPTALVPTGVMQFQLIVEAYTPASTPGSTTNASPEAQ